jgi:hypothetical protein
MPLLQLHPHVLVVVGMHRSGTSASTGALRCVGVDLGDKLYAGHAAINAKGYFEHSDLADANDEALLAIGSSWDDVLPRPAGWQDRTELAVYARRIQAILQRDFARSPIWAVKDPRVSRLLPWWLCMLQGMRSHTRMLFVVRSPIAVARSLGRRDGFSEEKSALLWLRHYLEAEETSRGLPRAFMAFDRFVAQPVAELERVESALGIQFPVSPNTAAQEISGFVSPALQHHKNQGLSAPAGVAMTIALDVERVLLGACSRAGGQPDPLPLQKARQTLNGLESAWPDVLREHIQQIGARRGAAELTLNKLTRSWSWYTGKPVRYVERLLGRHV